MIDDERVQSDGVTVWVHDATDGSCTGRFGRMGIDIHRPASEQEALGQCLLCTHGPTGPAEWLRFVKAMKDIYGVTVSDRHRPRHIPNPVEEKTMQKTTVYVVTGEHHAQSGRPMTVHFTSAAADAAAFDLVRTIAGDVDGVPDGTRDAAAWRGYLADVQRAIVAGRGETAEDDDDLDDASGCYVDIAVLEADAPRVVVSLDGGLVQGIVADIALDGYVVDYDVDGAPLRDLVDIPQTGGTTSEGLMRGESVEVDPTWIGDAMTAYEAHDPDAIEETDEGEEG
jgi:hypothetical protein